MSTTRNRRLSVSRKLFYSLFLFFVFLLALLLVGEISVRVLVGIPCKKSRPPPPYNTATKDPLLGWKMTPNYSWSGVMKDYGGNEYNVSIQYDENGFKVFGDTGAGKPRVFFEEIQPFGRKKDEMVPDGAHPH